MDFRTKPAKNTPTANNWRTPLFRLLSLLPCGAHGGFLDIFGVAYSQDNVIIGGNDVYSVGFGSLGNNDLNNYYSDVSAAVEDHNVQMPQPFLQQKQHSQLNPYGNAEDSRDPRMKHTLNVNQQNLRPDQHHHQQQQLLRQSQNPQNYPLERIMTEPLHRSILRQKKRNRRDPQEHQRQVITNEEPKQQSRRRQSQSTAGNKNSNNSNQYPRPPHTSRLQNEPPWPILSSPFWVQISEEYGENVFNYIPESRRAASSALFVYDYLEDRKKRKLENAEQDEHDVRIDVVVQEGDEVQNIEDVEGVAGARPREGEANGANNSSEDDKPGTEGNVGGFDANQHVEETVQDDDATNVGSSIKANATKEPNVESVTTVTNDGQPIGTLGNGMLNSTMVINSTLDNSSIGEANEEDNGSTFNNDNVEIGTASPSASAKDTGPPNKSIPNPSNSKNLNNPNFGEEYMILSGGYTDHDWKSFPVYAFPTSSSLRTLSGKWIELTPTDEDFLYLWTEEKGWHKDKAKNYNPWWCNSEEGAVARDRLYKEAQFLTNHNDNDPNDNNNSDPWAQSLPCSPPGRMGHSSVIYNDHLYVFGGLIYDEELTPAGSRKRESFRLEDVPYVYRLDLGEMLELRRGMERGRGGRNMKDETRDDNEGSYDVSNTDRIVEVQDDVGKDKDNFIEDLDKNSKESLESPQTEQMEPPDQPEQSNQSGDGGEGAPVSPRRIKGWQRIIPRVKPFPTMAPFPPMTSHANSNNSNQHKNGYNDARSSAAAAEVLLKSVNRGESQGGLWTASSMSPSFASSTTSDNEKRAWQDGHDRFVMYGGLRIAALDYDGYGNGGQHGPYSPSMNEGDEIKESPGSMGSTSASSGSSRPHRIVELPLGDIWAYDLVLDSWEKVTNDFGLGVDLVEGATNGEDGSDKKHANENSREDEPEGLDRKNEDNILNDLDFDDDDTWWQNLDATLFPRPRTAHAATIVGDELVLHGGMATSISSTDEYHWDGSREWETLDDMWVFDLGTRKWKRRWLFPLLLRSYHSLVGWNVKESLEGSIVKSGDIWNEDDYGGDIGDANESDAIEKFDNVSSWEGSVVCAFGGYTTGVDVFSGEEVAYVFDDLLISYPPPLNSASMEPSSPWLKAKMPTSQQRDGASLISNRFEHSAVLSRHGTMHVWGGQFQGTSDVKGMWAINVAGEDSRVNFILAEEDGIYDEYEATITALHTIIVMMMFMSMSLTLMLGLTQRYHELMQQANEEAAVAGMAAAGDTFGGESPPVVSGRRGRGLHPEIIDTIPEKIYRSSEHGNVNESSRSERDAHEENTEEFDCCPICLVEYEDGDELRVLPCNHFMHKSCVDAWLRSNPSCPSCRYSFSELVDDRPMMQLNTLRSRISSSSSALARFLSSQDGILFPGSIQLRNSEDDEAGENGIEMTADFGDGSGPRMTILDLRYVSSLVLSEEDTEQNGNNQGEETRGAEPYERRHRSQRMRGSRLQGLARMRRQRRPRDGSTVVPLNDPLEDVNEHSVV